MVNRSAWTWTLVILVLLISGGLAVYLYWPVVGTGPSEPNLVQSQPPVPVRTVSVRRDAWPRTVEALGTTLASESVVVTAEVQGVVKRIDFREGARVEAGEVLVELAAEEERARLQEAQARLQEKKKQYERYQRLFQKQNVSRAELEAQQASYESVLAEVQALRERLQKFTIRSSFDGILGLREVSPGSLVSPGTPLTTLDDLSWIKLDFSVPEQRLNRLKPGLEIRARTPAFPEDTFRGELQTLDPRVDPVTRMVQARARIPNAEARLRPGMLMNVTVVLGTRQVMVVPEESLLILGNRQYVYRVDAENVARRTEVEPGDRRPGWVEIVSGLEPGDTVIREGTMKTRDGATVRPLQTEEDAPAEQTRAHSQTDSATRGRSGP